MAAAIQEERLRELFLATQYHGNELLLELVAEDSDAGVAQVLDRMWAIDKIGVRPDWWKLPAFSNADAWTDMTAFLGRPLQFCRGIVLVGTGPSGDDFGRTLACAARHPFIQGFAIGGTNILEPARGWLAANIDDARLDSTLRERFVALALQWTDAAR